MARRLSSPFRIARQRLQDLHQALAQALHAGRLEQVRGILDHAAQALRRLGEEHAEVGLRRRGVDRQRLSRQARRGELGWGRVLQREQDLEQGVVGLAPRRVEQLHYPLERQILVGVGPQARLPHAADQLRHRRIARQVGPQHQGIDEEAHQIVQRRIGPSSAGLVRPAIGAPMAMSSPATSLLRRVARAA